MFDGLMSIIIGPNGGGKTNLLDTLVTVLRRYLLSTSYLQMHATENNIEHWLPQLNQSFSGMSLEKHSNGNDLDQCVEIEIEVTPQDVENVCLLRDSAPEILSYLVSKSRRIHDNPWEKVLEWPVNELTAGMRLTYSWTNWQMASSQDAAHNTYLSYLRLFEMDSALRAEVGMKPLSAPLLYLPVHRAASGLISNVALSAFDEKAQRQSIDTTTSRTTSSVMSLAIGRLAKQFRLLQEETNVDARMRFQDTDACKSITETLSRLGYSWELATKNALTNEYSIRLTKQGSSFLVDHASSGEKEILNYIFAIYALEIRNAVVVVDEPELHLHPKWQKVLVDLFGKLSKDTGNQFVMATHSPTFVSPSSIEFVSRVFSHEQQSQIVRLNSSGLPGSKHLFNLVNSHNNERLFFTNKVVLVEGITDRLVFEKILESIYGTMGHPGSPEIEIINVGGKGLFEAYSLILQSCQIDYCIIADFDYIEQIGTPELKAMFKLNAREIKNDVIDNVKSMDGDALAAAIREGLNTKNFDLSNSIWQYIESKRRVLRQDLSATEKRQLANFLADKRDEQIFVLSEGALEDYLPAGFRAKDVQKVVDFVSGPKILDRMRQESRHELEMIAKAILVN
ncbi:putative ATP-binding protein involved in virulence [Agrobacterium sp. DSM 25558]|nr:putative ATP-binding protein involved in virulence [Agrobacterium sp. DSM 25558]